MLTTVPDGYTLLASDTIDASGTITTLPVLANGVEYLVRVSETAVLGTVNGNSRPFDAEWFDFGVPGRSPTDVSSATGIDTGVRLDGVFGAGHWGDYREDHEYTQAVMGTGSALTAHVDDYPYTDNTGQLYIEVFARFTADVSIDYVIEDEEMTEGAYTLVNSDDDNGNEIVDSEELTAVDGENDLVPVDIAISDTFPEGTDVTLSLNAAGAAEVSIVKFDPSTGAKTRVLGGATTEVTWSKGSGSGSHDWDGLLLEARAVSPAILSTVLTVTAQFSSFYAVDQAADTNVRLRVMYKGAEVTNNPPEVLVGEKIHLDVTAGVPGVVVENPRSSWLKLRGVLCRYPVCHG